MVGTTSAGAAARATAAPTLVAPAAHTVCTAAVVAARAVTVTTAAEQLCTIMATNGANTTTTVDVNTVVSWE